MKRNYTNFGSECNSRTVQLGTVQIDRNMLRLYRNFHAYLTETSFICMVRRSCSQTTCVICSSAQKQWINCSIVPACESIPESTKILIIFTSKRILIINSSLHHELPWKLSKLYSHGNLKWAKKYNEYILIFMHTCMVNWTKKQRNSIFPW